MISIEQIASTQYCLDMRGDENWTKKVNRLREILKLAAPLDEDEPKYTFAPFYYCQNGRWYENRWGKYPCVSVFDVELPSIKKKGKMNGKT